jgi:hypothetical protein
MRSLRGVKRVSTTNPHGTNVDGMGFAAGLHHTNQDPAVRGIPWKTTTKERGLKVKQSKAL